MVGLVVGLFVGLALHSKSPQFVPSQLQQDNTPHSDWSICSEQTRHAALLSSHPQSARALHSLPTLRLEHDIVGLIVGLVVGIADGGCGDKANIETKCNSNNMFTKITWRNIVLKTTIFASYIYN